jgi:cytochrome c oxidase assembly protein subunit 15
VQEQALYNLAPLLELVALGAVIALLPLAWVLWRHRGAGTGARLQALIVLTLFLTFDLVMFGAFTRLTDSGLGCPDWPGCYGKSTPIAAHSDIAAAQLAMPTGPVTHGKAWVEMIHRYLASAVGMLIIAITLALWAAHRKGKALISPWWSTFTLLWVCLQGAFGALTVTMRLFPAIVTAHLLGGMALLALLGVQAVRHGMGVERQEPVALSRGLRWALWGGLLLLVIQITLGGWVSTNYAVLACTTFPACQGSLWPDMDFVQGFQVWRELGVLKDGSSISFAALTAIHYVHRLAAYVVFAALLGLVFILHRRRVLPVQRRWLLWLTLLQLVTGLSNVVLDWPLLAAVLHTGGAAAMVMVLVWALAASRTRHVGLSDLPSDVSRVTA